VVEDAERLAAAVQDRDPRSTLSLFRRLIRLRRATPALRDGDQTMLDAAPHVLAWVREADGERWLTAINMSLHDQATGILLPDGATGELVLSTDPDRTEGPVELGELRLGVDEGVLIRLDEGGEGTS
jgi:alpha-glucosidase